MKQKKRKEEKGKSKETKFPKELTIPT